MNRYWTFLFFFLGFAFLNQTQGCSCANEIVLPRVEGERFFADGFLQLKDAAFQEEFASKSDEKRLPELKREEKVELEQKPDATKKKCPNPRNILCFHCDASLESKERIVLLHRHYLLTKAGENFRLFDLRKGCQSRIFEWKGIEEIIYSQGDPTSSKVLFFGQGFSSGGVVPARLGFFDLEHPSQPLRELSLPKGSQYLFSRALRENVRRGVLSFKVWGKTKPLPQVNVHYQMEDASLKLIALPKDHILYRSGRRLGRFFELYEVYVLQKQSPREFPLMIWSVKQQKVLKIIHRSRPGIPQAIFASSKDIFSLSIDPKDRGKKELRVFPIHGGTASTLLASGCDSLLGDNHKGILVCFGKGVIYRFRLPSKVALPSIRVNTNIMILSYFDGRLYFSERSKLGHLSWIDLLATKPNFVRIGVLLPKSLSVMEPDLSSWGSKQTFLRKKYRVIRGSVGTKHRIGILNVEKGTFKFIENNFPIPAVMGRMTEFWSFYRSSFSYIVEPTRSTASPEPSAFFIRNDKASIFYMKKQAVAPYSFQGKIDVSSGVQRIQVVGETFYPKPQPSKLRSELTIVDHERYLSQQLKTTENVRVFYSDQFLVIETTDSSKYRILKVYQVAK